MSLQINPKAVLLIRQSPTDGAVEAAENAVPVLRSFGAQSMSGLRPLRFPRAGFDRRPDGGAKCNDRDGHRTTKQR